MSQINKSRRDLVRMMGLSAGYLGMSSPLSMLIEAISLGVINKAHGAATDKKYLLCQLEGAPSRWGMDLFLNPYNTAAITTNQNIGTRFVAINGRYTETTYATIQRTDYKGRPINVPWMWQFTVPKAGGGNRPMDELLKHMVQIRGMNINQGQHEAAQALHMHPLGAKQSLTAIAADRGSAYIPGVNLGANYYSFISTRNLTAVTIPNGGNMVETLMTPFMNRSNPTLTANKRTIASTLEAATSALDNLAKSKDVKVQALADNRASAQHLLENGIVGMSTFWTPAVAKYTDLINRSIGVNRTRLAGIDDLPLGTLDVANRTGVYAINVDTKCDVPDMRDMIRTITTISLLAEHFALSEFVLTQNLSNSVTIAPGAIRHVYNLNNSYQYIHFDEHNVGGMVATFYNTLYNRALSACMLELIDQLKAKNMWQNTVIDISSEFGRVTRQDGTGSDHGSNGGSSALYTGALQNGPIVMGNITRDDTFTASFPGATSRYHGTWGRGVRYQSLNEILHAGHMAATLAYLLGAPSPVTSASSMVRMGASGLEAVFDELPTQV